jgi:hypothetical protein
VARRPEGEAFIRGCSISAGSCPDEGFPFEEKVKGVQKVGNALTVLGGNAKGSSTCSGTEMFKRGKLLRIGRIDFRGRNLLGFVQKLGIVKLEFVPENPVGFFGVIRSLIADIEKMKKNLGTLDMTEKPVPQPFPFVGSFDQAGKVRNHIFMIVGRLSTGNHTQVGI